MKIVLRTKGDFRKIDSWFEKKLEAVKLGDLDKYGREGVEALRHFTPKDTGKTSESWYYEIERKDDIITLSFNNSNFNQGVPIAIILQYGHGTRNGGFVQGVDYINPALKPIFEKILNDMWEEVRK